MERTNDKKLWTDLWREGTANTKALRRNKVIMFMKEKGP